MKKMSEGKAKLPKDHWEKDAAGYCEGTGKYAEGEMSNPEELNKSVEGLNKYVKGHKPKK